MSTHEYDMLVIGSGPAGQKAAIQAAKVGKHVGIIDLNTYVGGVCLHDGTIPSKSFREAILQLSGWRLKSHFGEAFRIKQQIEIEDLTRWSSGIVSEIEQTLREHLLRNGVDIICGIGKFLDANHVQVKHKNKQQTLSADYIVIATGTSARHPKDFEFDNEIILDSNGILYMERLPKSITIVGGGVIGCEYGSMFATLGIKVTIVEARPSILKFVDSEICESFAYHLRSQRATILTNEKVIRCARSSDGRAITYLESGKRLVSDVLLVSAGRVGNVGPLHLDAVGITSNENGIILINEHFQTTVPNIYAVGDVTGYPALASTSFEEGRHAACHAFDIENEVISQPQPFGIYTIPEISMVGNTEQELSAEKISYETGIARFREIEKGKIIGESRGFLKILFHRESLELLGIHAIGENATEIIHVGQALMLMKGTLKELVHMVFNYPTLSHAYKIAALDGLNKIVAVHNLEEEGT